MGVSGDDHINSVHSLGQFVILTLFAVRSGVGQTDDEIRLLILFQICHGASGCIRNGFKLHTGHGCAVVGILTQQAKYGNTQTVAFHDHIVADAVCPPSFPGLRIALRRMVVGLYDQWQLLTACHSRMKHFIQSGGPVVKLMIAQGGHIVSHGTHKSQFMSLRRENGLKQGSHGKIAAIQSHNGILRCGSLLLEQSGQTGKSAVLAALFRSDRQYMVVHIVGKQNGQARFLALCGSGNRKHSGTQNDQCSQKGRQSLFHVCLRCIFGLNSKPSIPINFFDFLLGREALIPNKVSYAGA